MLRSTFLLLFIFLSGRHILAQQSVSITWKVEAERLQSNEYQLHIQGTVPASKFVYLRAPVETGVDSFRIEFFDSSIQKIKFIPKSGVKSIQDPLFEGASMQVGEKELVLHQTIRFKESVPAVLRGRFLYTCGGTNEFFPGEEFAFEVSLAGGQSRAARILIPSIDVHHPANTCGDVGTKGQGLLGIFFLGLIGGLFALITPCVFPLIPLTVSFFTKKSGTQKQAVGRAVLYGVFILLIYVLLSIPFHLIDQTNPEILNTISTNVWLNLIFFFIFIFFAISFFGYFEITLPGRFASISDSKADLKSMTGIFFMALTLAIVSFSCTGPILGSLLAGALTKDGGAWQLSAGMAGFGLGLALPFALFAMFPQWLQSLPKSGGWLNTVKVVLGFLELAMALKFLSNADLVEQWGLIKRELFFAVWIIIGIAIVLYLAGVIKFPHDDAKPVISRTRSMFILLFSAITIALIPGVTNSRWANLSFISGFPPPVCYSIYEHPVLCRNSLEPLRDYEQALALARKEKKPLLIDFTGWACVNCRRMEENVWTNSRVLSLMKDEFIVVSLYVDDRTRLPADQQQSYTTKSGSPKTILTIGDLWATFQSENFEAVAQPQYAILNGDEQLLTRTKSYTPDPEEFKNWLECGLRAYQKE